VAFHNVQQRDAISDTNRNTRSGKGGPLDSYLDGSGSNGSAIVVAVLGADKNLGTVRRVLKVGVADVQFGGKTTVARVPINVDIPLRHMYSKLSIAYERAPLNDYLCFSS
jgi:hypothetical protein